MTLLIIGGGLYAVLMLFILGAMYVSGRHSEGEERREQRDMARMKAHKGRQPQSMPILVTHKDAA